MPSLRILRPLGHGPFALLWSGHTLSVVAHEIYAVAFTWIIVGALGSEAAYVVAVATLASFIAVTFGGNWAERWSPRRTMAGVNAIRSVAAFALPAVMIGTGTTPDWLLYAVAIAVGCIAAFFDPALQISVPRLISPSGLIGANAMIEASRRIARVAGPAAVSALAGLASLATVLVIHCGIFLLSALAVARVSAPSLNAPDKPATSRGIGDALAHSAASGWQAIGDHKLMRFTVISAGITNGLWAVAYSVGLALLIKEQVADDPAVYSLVVGLYSASDLAATLVVGSVAIRRPGYIMYLGRLILGLGFIAIAAAPSIEWIIVAALVAGFSGPLSEVVTLALLQTDFKGIDVARIFRLKISIDSAARLVFFFLARRCFRHSTLAR